MKLRVMVVDDHEVVRLGMRAALEVEPDINVVGEATNGAEALAKLSVLAPEVVLMDVRMEKLGGIEACREITGQYPDIKVLMLTSFDDDDALAASLLAGARGYLLKNVSRAELLRAVRKVASGTMLLDAAMLGRGRRRLDALAGRVAGPEDALTEREREVLALVAKGFTNRQIAETLCLSEKTARNHLSHILEKLGLSRRSEAAVYAVEHQLLKRDDPQNKRTPDRSAG
ncbi:MAG TPA: response regulator transcription factor [Ktedonobacterales bacterium]|jgi:DNA-binding NarL/FixJ family response regulator|nr:response regulator transcription factor [Ktedonobacterales bacterium]